MKHSPYTLYHSMPALFELAHAYIGCTSVAYIVLLYLIAFHFCLEKLIFIKNISLYIYLV